MKRLFLVALVLLAASGVGAAWGVHEYSAPGPLTQGKTLIFKRGLGFSGIVEQLGAEGVVAHPLYFKAVAAITGNAVRFKAGEYAFSPRSSVKDVLTMLAGGHVVIHKITIAEGLTVRDITALLNAELVLEGAVPADIAEGSLLPETYYFTYGDTRAAIISRMQKALRDTVEAAWDKRKQGLPLGSPHDALVLASIVEKETGVKEERGHVASVYINRLRRGIALQADPTVIYGIERATGAPLSRSLTLADLKTPSPYNTYVNAGLPPTPIANPGKASISAVLNPPNTPDIYFVATGTGGHRFAATLEQHNRNVAAYHAAMAMQRRQQQAPKKQ